VVGVMQTCHRLLSPHGESLASGVPTEVNPMLLNSGLPECAGPGLSCTRVAMRRFVRSKIQVAKQIKQAGRRRSVCGVFEDRMR
jgi:hypothetical protein